MVELRSGGLLRPIWWPCVWSQVSWFVLGLELRFEGVGPLASQVLRAGGATIPQGLAPRQWGLSLEGWDHLDSHVLRASWVI